MVSLMELEFEKELLENIPVEDIRKMLEGEVLFWIRGSAASPNRPYGMYYALLDYKGNVRYLEGNVTGATAYGAILAGILDGANQLKSPVRFHVICPTAISFQWGEKTGVEDKYIAQLQEIFSVLKGKNCQLSYSQADSEVVKKWVMSYCPDPPEPKENKYKRIIYKECLQKVKTILQANGVSAEIIKEINAISPNI